MQAAYDRLAAPRCQIKSGMNPTITPAIAKGPIVDVVVVSVVSVATVFAGGGGVTGPEEGIFSK